MIVHPETEKRTLNSASGGLWVRGGGAISTITLDGGIEATGAMAILYNGTNNTGTEIWRIRSPRYDSRSVTFSKPIPFTTGLYVELTPVGQLAKLSVACD